MTEQNSNLPQVPEPMWNEEVSLSDFDSLTEDLTVDAVIVGGGITGIATAYLLSQKGVKVALIESTKLMNGTTGHTTAKVTAQHDLIYDELLNNFGYNVARMYYEANIDALQLIEKTVTENNIDCDFEKQDAVIYSTSGEYKYKLENEYKAYERLNIKGDLTTQTPFNISIENALTMKNQAQFHPLKYLAHLVKFITDNGGQIFENTTAVNIESDGSKQTVLTRNGKRITANYVLSCSHFPFYEGKGAYFTRLHADRSYVLAVKTSLKYPGGMYLSTDQPTRSLRSAKLNGEEVILIGGDGHKSGQGKDLMKHYKALKRFTDTLYGENGYDILYRWSTQDLVTLDKLPYVGPITKDQPNILVATGYRKWGMTNSHVAAQLMTDKVLGNINHYENVYTPSRFSTDPSLKKFFMENLDVAKHLIKGKLEPAQAAIEDLNNDEGAVIKINGARKGAYKDQDGKVHIVDTTCTHAGCEVNWNNAERTWDCPCHGSRFSYTGEVIEGPAEKPLKKHDFGTFDIFDDKESGY
ncbi:FAD-dependent oxidoreductase [Bacillaceae bacterium W0354]